MVQLNRNVKLGFLFSTLNAISVSILTQQLLATYIFQLTHDNSPVGLVSSASGISQVVFAWPAGMLADKMGRARMLKWCTVVGVVYFVAQTVAVALNSLTGLYIAACCAGAFTACSQAPLMSLISDSSESGAARTRIFIYTYTLQLLSGAAGPIIAILFFWRLGDTWSADRLQKVLLGGVVILAMAICVLPCFEESKMGTESEAVANVEDREVLVPEGGEEDAEAEAEGQAALEGSAAAAAAGAIEEGSLRRGLGAPAGALSSSDDPAAELEERLLAASDRVAAAAAGHSMRSPSGPLQPITEGTSSAASSTRSMLSTASTATTSAGKHRGVRVFKWGPLTLKSTYVPFIIFGSDITMGTGAGMTVAFFGLWFERELLLTPTQVAGVLAAAPAVVAIFSLLSIPIGRRLGRTMTAIFWDAVGTLCILIMSFPMPAWCSIFFYLVRTAAMNAAYPGQRALLNDYVAKERRGRWNSCENVTAFTWTGSAALGGFLVDKYSYRYTFRITFGIYAVATAILSLLIPITKGDKSDYDPPPKPGEKSAWAQLTDGMNQSLQECGRGVAGCWGRAAGGGAGEDAFDGGAAGAGGRYRGFSTSLSSSDGQPHRDFIGPGTGRRFFAPRRSSTAVLQSQFSVSSDLYHDPSTGSSISGGNGSRQGGEQAPAAEEKHAQGVKADTF